MLNVRAKAPQFKQWLLATAFLSATPVLATTEVPLNIQDTTPEVINGYIKDDLFIFMHVGSSKKFKILGSINASTPVTVMDRNDETGFVKIKDERGRIGWVEQISFSTTPSVQVKMAQLQSQYDELKAINEQDQSEITRLNDKLLQAEKVKNQTELKISKLVSQRDNLGQQVELKQDETELKKMLYGAAICVVGLILGLLLPMLAPRKRRGDHWV
jgi:SH3 domain protein